VPVLSVVVPVFQMERYLAECLDSALASTFTDLEVVAVDDGSTDGSPRILAEAAARDPRVRVVRQDNAGLGAARNTGVRHARGELITFLDSDDTVPPDAYRVLVETLRTSGSDFVVGALEKQVGRDYRVPVWLVRLHRCRRTGLHIDDLPEMLPNIFAVNKVYRRAFWDRAGITFPVGVSYEDHVPLTTAFLTADAFDVVPDVVYRWRTRDGEDLSITQRKHEVQNVTDAVHVKQRVCDVVDRLASPVVAALWHRKMFNDLRPYLEQVPAASDAYWQVLSAGTADLLARAAPGELAQVEARLRVLCTLTAHGRRDDVVRVLQRLDDDAATQLATLDGRDVLAVHDLVPDLPADLVTLVPADRAVRARLVSVTVDGDDLVVEGVAQVLGVADHGVEPSATVRLVDPADGTEQELASRRVQALPAHRPARPVGAPAPVGFVARCPRPSGVRHVEVVVRVDGVEVAGPFTGRRPQALEQAPEARWEPGRGLVLSAAGRSRARA
jgi:CDP-glycerol glycerophosphotransferase